MTFKEYIHNWIKWFLCSCFYWGIFMLVLNILLGNSWRDVPIPPTLVALSLATPLNLADGRGFRWYKLVIASVLLTLLWFTMFVSKIVLYLPVWLLVLFVVTSFVTLKYVYRFKKKDWLRWFTGY
ncbi:hypothetical protein [Streptococcus merionis]|uniref:Uncharacterized protein n=1 Tax=Streptococcus merionis TaxID=400065 RepID=A0A239T164_9STRE|nr:hypothetical protein [Streptococcus merionis]SNU90684.1 Uncharacterised protein [Streptococcus merionis]